MKCLWNLTFKGLFSQGLTIQQRSIEIFPKLHIIAHLIGKYFFDRMPFQNGLESFHPDPFIFDKIPSQKVFTIPSQGFTFGGGSNYLHQIQNNEDIGINWANSRSGILRSALSKFNQQGLT